MFDLDDFTPELRAKMGPFADSWIERVSQCGPADRATVEDGIRRCYEAAGIPWHNNVVWVRSPVAASIAGPIASLMLTGAVDDAVTVAVRSAVRHAVDGAVDDAVHDAVTDAVDGAVRSAVDGAVHGAVHGAVRSAVRHAVDGAVDDAVTVAVDDAVHDAVTDAVDDAVHDAVTVAVDDAVTVAVHGAVTDAVDGAVRSAVDDAVHGAVHGAVDGAVRSAVRHAVDGAVDGAVRSAVRRAWWRVLSPWWSWIGWRTFIVNELGITELDHVRHLVEAWNDASGAGWWWPHRDFVIVSDRPTTINREQIAPTGWGSHVLHCETGPSISWGDEWSLWHWHGIQVPSWVIENPTVERIQAEANTEIRRCAIESYGWDRYLDHCAAEPVHECDDPGNPGHVLRLFDVADMPYETPTRLLVMQNASRDRDGSRRTFAETVPAGISRADDAAAWQFDVPAGEYRQLARAT